MKTIRKYLNMAVEYKEALILGGGFGFLVAVGGLAFAEIREFNRNIDREKSQQLPFMPGATCTRTDDRGGAVSGTMQFIPDEMIIDEQ